MVVVIKMEIQMRVMMIRDREHSQSERVRVVNVNVVMPTGHVTDGVVRLSNGHGDSFDRKQSPCTRINRMRINLIHMHINL